MQSLTSEFELVGSSADVVVANTVTNTSTNWQLENCCIQAELCQIDNALQNRFDQHMLEGKHISIPYTQIITTTQTTASSKDISINMTRSASRLQKLYMTMFKTGEETLTLIVRISIVIITLWVKDQVELTELMTVIKNCNSRFKLEQNQFLNDQLNLYLKHIIILKKSTW